MAGCAGSNDGDVLNPANNDLNGTWDYLITNAFEARFVGCTGDATVLEGTKFIDGLSLAPICMNAVRFDVTQSGEAFDVPPHQGVCSLGSPASVTGSGFVQHRDLGGEWRSVSDDGVTAVQVFSGVIAGNTIELSESARTFSGDFNGGCSLSPPLTTLVTVQ
jgi:hypothetical protein